MSNPFFPFGQPYGPPFTHQLPYPHNVPNQPGYMWNTPHPSYQFTSCCAPPPPPPPPVNYDNVPGRTHANAPGTALPGTNGLQFSLPSGVGYVFSKHTATINLITSNLQPWENPGGTFQFKVLKVPVDMPVSDLIEQLCPERGPENQNVVSRGIVECHERGGGRWAKGHEFYIGEGRGKDEGMADKVGKSIKSYGWDQTRGDDTMPIWLSSMLVYG